MKSITINGSKRESVGKKATKALRNAGMVPCVLYGENNPVHFTAKELDFSKLVYTPNAHTVVLKLDGKTTVNAILQDIQFHPVSDRILHVDFYELKDDKEISMNIPVELTGAAPGVLISGGRLLLNKRKLRVKALPSNLPDIIVVDISELEIGNKLYTSSIKSEKFSFVHPDNTVICQVRTSRAAIIEEVEVATEDGETSSEETTEAAE
ncbi:MAG: 50S ribosomal protein L25/general stress protein Ctc [Flavobacteriaceae bacterium]|jgi:large subunit ribosomal protein L25|nr:50S ribosomal protein L25/general stress protein Ctc [Flavobacteriaceae bacterium]MDO7581603.1 50S ribosomal protein L25/general stress protein Ctc [Flavobacteriaceae bacterium]MDO7590857.1 50S ribosomal protein L25/general stress protein Ctc [Flavobacteriaceae bacterium]MDO7598926.1 50S ribosomal protein L25/general stress protein Ctc [Flavobacteriaceae bacterium]MDO7603572.1 50S ribosomal protein L25/general stress protein Ctc [Flavobacteriaceae bacterium]